MRLKKNPLCRCSVTRHRRCSEAPVLRLVAALLCSLDSKSASRWRGPGVCCNSAANNHKAHVPTEPLRRKQTKAAQTKTSARCVRVPSHETPRKRFTFISPPLLPPPHPHPYNPPLSRQAGGGAAWAAVNMFLAPAAAAAVTLRGFRLPSVPMRQSKAASGIGLGADTDQLAGERGENQETSPLRSAGTD